MKNYVVISSIFDLTFISNISWRITCLNKHSVNEKKTLLLWGQNTHFMRTKKFSSEDFLYENKTLSLLGQDTLFTRTSHSGKEDKTSLHEDTTFFLLGQNVPFMRTTFSLYEDKKFPLWWQKFPLWGQNTAFMSRKLTFIRSNHCLYLEKILTILGAF